METSEETPLHLIVRNILEKEAWLVKEYLASNKAVLGAFMGSVMKETKGCADPYLAKAIIESELDKLSN